MTQAVPGLRRLELAILKDKSGSDAAQVPAAASIQVYRQGAVSQTTVTLAAGASSTSPIVVSDIGSIRKNDVLGIFRSGAWQSGSLTVTVIDSATTFDVHNGSSSTVTLQVGDRLIPTNPLPSLYSDHNGLQSQLVANPFSTDATTGRASAYLYETRFDYVVSVSGLFRLYPDAEGGPVVSPITTINALDYDDLQNAVNAVPPLGGMVFIPAGTFDPTTRPAFNPPLVLPNNRPVHLLGAGPRDTILRYVTSGDYGSDPNKDLIHLTGDYQTIEGITLKSGTMTGTTFNGVGVRIWRDGGSAALVYRACIRDCEFDSMQSWAIYIDDALRGGVAQFAVWGFYDNLDIHDSQHAGGIYIGGGGTTTQFFKSCNVKQCAGPAVQAHTPEGLSFLGCTFENNARPELVFDSCNSVAVRDCWFQDYLAAGDVFVLASGTYRGLTIDACTFRQVAAQGASGGSDLQAIRLSGFGRAVVIRSCEFRLQNNPLATGSGHAQVIVDAPSGGGPSEVTVIACCGQDSSGPILPRIQDGSTRTVLLNTAARIRLPQVTQAERDALADLHVGDMVYNTTTNKAQILNVVGPPPVWNDLW